jgi:hypothetical protein
MVQSTLVKSILGVIVRVFLLAGILIFGFLLSNPFYFFLVKTLGYHESCGGFFELCGFETEALSLVISYIFWVTFVFGILGKKMDYIFSTILFLLAFLLFTQEKNITPQMYIGLIGVALLGNALGYILKIGRENWFGKK